MEHGSVFSTSGGIDPIELRFIKELHHSSLKNDTILTVPLFWLRYRMNFSLLCSAIMCIRGSRTSVFHPVKHSVMADIGLAFAEGKIAT